MNTTESNRDKLLYKVNALEEREIAVVLAVLQHFNNFITVVRNKDYLLKAIVNVPLNEDALLDLLNDSKSVLSPEDSIRWITKNLRASLWFSNYYQNHLIATIHFCVNESSNHVDYIITGIDCSFTILPPNPQMNLPYTPNDSTKPCLINNYNFNVEYKLKSINNAQALYYAIYTQHKYTDWIEVKNQDQLYWAVDYLSKAGMLIKPYLFMAQNNEEMFAQICASLDALDNYHDTNLQYTPSVNKKYFISNMRKAWSQKKFRDKQDMEAAQEHIFSRKYMHKLELLSSEHGVSSVDYLKHLIDEAFDSRKQ